MFFRNKSVAIFRFYPSHGTLRSDTAKSVRNSSDQSAMI